LRVKELRNVLRMAAGTSNPKFVDDLGRVKDAIGEWHDWEELVLIAQKALDHGNGCELMRELKRVAEGKYEHALGVVQALRKKYWRNAVAPKKGAAATPTMPREPVWEAIALLAG